MNIILIGAPGSGKGTQSNFIKKKYNIPKISIGDILRSSFILSKEKKEIHSKINSGHLLDDKIVCNLVKSRIFEEDCKNGFLLDGFPRTLEQAYFIKKEKIKIQYILELWIPPNLILKRILGRQIHLPSGRIYHSIFKPPIQKGVDDITGQKLISRTDDNIISLKKRIQEYEKFSQKIIKYYQEEQIKSNFKYFRINANNSIFKINEIIKKILN